jgi:hypothetical protein
VPLPSENHVKETEDDCFGRVEETNGVQSWPKRAKPVVFSVNLLSMRAQARRIDG